MADRPILFSTPMVRALLDGRKTQTRRIITKRAALDALDVFGLSMLMQPGCADLLSYACGDRLWVREAHYLTDDGTAASVVFAADGIDVAEHRAAIEDMQRQYGLPDDWARPHLKLRPSIHLPRWASRLTLTVTDVRVQRLQEISEVDARAEGAWIAQHSGRVSYDYATMAVAGIWFATARGWYCDLWDSIHGTGAWDANPWVAPTPSLSNTATSTRCAMQPDAIDTGISITIRGVSLTIERRDSVEGRWEIDFAGSITLAERTAIGKIAAASRHRAVVAKARVRLEQIDDERAELEALLADDEVRHAPSD